MLPTVTGLGPSTSIFTEVAFGEASCSSIFALTQIFIDLESARNVLLHAYPIHGHLHSLIGVTLAGLVAAALGPHVFNALNSPL